MKIPQNHFGGTLTWGLWGTEREISRENYVMLYGTTSCNN